jgi:hypothetical protein
VAHWDGDIETSWDAIYARMVETGRLSRVKRPTKAHTAKTFSRLARWSPEQKITP